MDIFDDDNEVEFIQRPSTSASTNSDSSGKPLFLPDEDEEDLTNDGQDKVSGEVNQIFDNVLGEEFDFVPITPKTINYDNLEREAQRKAKAKVPRHEILSSSPPRPDFANDASNKGKGKGKGDGEQKERRKPMRLDEARLVGPTGFPQLIEDTKHFRIKGKGHEVIFYYSPFQPI